MQVEFILLSVQVLISFLGILGNILVCVVMYSKRRRKSGTDFYIQGLAVADLLVLCVNFPLAVIKEKLPSNWPLGEFTCRYLYSLPEVFYGASVWTIVAIAVQRYKAVVKQAPIRGERVLDKARKVSICLWLVSFLVFSVPLYFAVEYKETAMGETLCFPNWSDNPTERRLIEVSFLFILLICSYVAPVVLILLTYVAVSRKLHQSSNFVTALHIMTAAKGRAGRKQSFTKTQILRLAQNRKARAFLTPIVIVFVLSMLPLNGLRTGLIFNAEITGKEFFPILLYLVTVCVIINSAVNPLIYSLNSQEFRKEIKHVCGQWSMVDKRTRINRQHVINL